MEKLKGSDLLEMEHVQVKKGRSKFYLIEAFKKKLNEVLIENIKAHN